MSRKKVLQFKPLRMFLWLFWRQSWPVFFTCLYMKINKKTKVETAPPVGCVSASKTKMTAQCMPVILMPSLSVAYGNAYGAAYSEGASGGGYVNSPGMVESPAGKKVGATACMAILTPALALKQHDPAPSDHQADYARFSASSRRVASN
jgi:hypothetical protein